jgi:hypothetical protein
MEQGMSSYNKLRDEKTFIFEDFSVNLEKEFAFQTDVSNTIKYEKDYFEKYVHMENTEIAKKINKFRTEITSKYCQNILDIGIGSGEFIKSSKIKVYGYDINPYGKKWLEEQSLFLNPYEDNVDNIEGFSFWDSIEHFYEPTSLLAKIHANKYIFISLPVFEDIMQIKKSKHYRPNEHMTYFTIKGLVLFLEGLGYKILEVSSEEIKCGRESIFTFVAKKH